MVLRTYGPNLECLFEIWNYLLLSGAFLFSGLFLTTCLPWFTGDGPKQSYIDEVCGLFECIILWWSVPGRPVDANVSTYADNLAGNVL